MEAAGGGYKDIVTHGMFKGKPFGSSCCFLIKKTVILLVTEGEFGSRTTVDEAIKTIMKLAAVVLFNHGTVTTKPNRVLFCNTCALP